jgi:outer membrane protein assembly factor BamB
LANLFIVPALERPGLFFKSIQGEHRAGERLLGGSSSGTGAPHYTTIRALEPTSGALKWERRSAAGSSESGDLSGLLSTAGGLVFGSDKTQLLGLDIRNGHQVWSFEAGGEIYSPPVTYLAGDRQFVAFAAGDIVVALALSPSPSSARSH